MVVHVGGVGMSGDVSFKVIRPSQLPQTPLWQRYMKRGPQVAREITRLRELFARVQRRDQAFAEIQALEEALEQPSELTGRESDRVLQQYLRVLGARMLGRIAGVTVLDSRLAMAVFRAGGWIDDRGIVSRHVVTNAGVGFIVDAFQNLVELENMKFHGIGTGAVAEAVGDTALGTELTTQYNPDNTRATGSTIENGANVYRTVGTNTVDAAAAITEHGILSQAATGGGVLLDRSVFSVINLANGDSLQSTYDLTLTAGG